jgi:hypothetical protein
VSPANDEVFLDIRNALYRKSINTVSMDNLFLVDLAEEIAKDRPHSRTVADRALQRTHRCLPWLTELWNVTPERAKGRPVAALSNLRY